MKKLLYSIVLGLGLVAMTGCDLTEKNFSNIDASVYFQNEGNVKGAVSAIYARAAYGFCEYFYYLQEFSADQIAWRTWNGGSWGWDEGLKFVLSSHTWTSEAKIVDQAWGVAWETIGLCNQLITDLEGLDLSKVDMKEEDVKSYIAEVRTLRAWAYYNNFELWGGSLPLNVEVTTKVPGSASKDKTFEEGCKVVYDFICNELDTALVYLKDNGTTRVNPAMNRILKMRMLLNAEVFIGENHYKECLELAKKLYYDGEYGKHYDIVNDYRTIFEFGNEKCPEVVFAFAEKNGQLNTGWMRNCPGLPYTYTEFLDPFATNQSGWNCVCLAPSYDNNGEDLAGTPQVNADGTAYNSTAPQCFLGAPYNDKLGAVYERFEKGDIRKQSYEFPNGGRWNGGMFLKGAMKNITTGEAIKADADRDGAPLVYVDQVGQFGGTSSAVAHPVEVVESPRWGQTNSGYRLMKYPMYPTSTGIDYQDISEVEFRWAEVVYTLAECKMRVEGADPHNDSELAKVRGRYFNGAITDDVTVGWTNEEWMLHQWGLEFLGEGRRRRTDLRRFNKFTQGQWWFFGRAKDDAGVTFPVSRDRKYEWYPLPQAALGVNPGLVQTPGY
ncbi:MAG: RagB/SusD family nutrient uptake outer membrane protein [Paludibacteraceae bacterium]|nr:RagB/SusD family nutrient uptake outer membrane protein [Paludibacteraceae bacterium]